MDTLDAFTKLSQHIPDWLIKLDELSKQVASQNKRFDKFSHSSDRYLPKRKTGSTESLRPKDDIDVHTYARGSQTDTSSTRSIAQAQMPSLTPPRDPEQILTSKARKRKPASSLFATSGPARYRAKSMIIVYYDSAIQDGFESLVRSIASSRNVVRKAKLEAGYKARLASLGMEESPFPASGEMGLLESRGFRPRLERKQRTSDPLTEDASVPAAEVVDRDLENAQSLCEVAAHQYLRVGHCDGEISGSIESFHKCLKTSEKEVNRLRELLGRISEDDRVVDQEEEVVRDRCVAPAENPKQAASKTIQQPSMDVIEVDDGSDDASIQVDLSAFRRTRAS